MNQSFLARAMVALCGFSFAATSTQAILFRDIDQYAFKRVTPSTPLSGEFNIVTGDGDGPFVIGFPYDIQGWGIFRDKPGFDPAAWTVDSASAWFYLSDDLDPHRNEFAQFKIDGLNFKSREVGAFDLISGKVSASIEAAISEDGILRYQISSLRGDFLVRYARLDVQASARIISADAPDGGATALFLGTALLGLAGVRRGKFSPVSAS